MVEYSEVIFVTFMRFYEFLYIERLVISLARKLKTMDGNNAAAHVAYAFTEVAAIYPHHPILHNGGICR